MNKEWAWAHNTDDPVGKMVTQKIEPIRVVEQITPTLVQNPSPGVYVFDAGRNLAGWAAIKVKGEAGTKITLRFAETLYDNGFVNQENLRNAKVEDSYILSGKGEEAWEPSFTSVSYTHLIDLISRHPFIAYRYPIQAIPSTQPDILRLIFFYNPYIFYI